MFTAAEKTIVMAALSRETEAIKRFIKGASAALKAAAEEDLIAIGKVTDKVRVMKVA